ncbi:PKD domain-containing protein [Atlantibacter sp.]|uniref:chitinase n=1 Tax=Atlantibacter sp. TaxID=1903473 RepID=UPI0028A70892|nr:glycosyl hydrolase family 18 protein [Atlantibacter sp.]
MKRKALATAISVFCLCSMAAPAFALEAWSGQEGGDTYQVIFAGNVYSNEWWVGASNCPTSDDPSNPWRQQRAATAQEISQYGNPSNCDISNGAPAAKLPEFNSAQSYAKDDKVAVGGVSYKALTNIGASTFAPGQPNPWMAYVPVPQWEPNKVYDGGDIVLINGQGYKSLFYNIGVDPSKEEHQNPTGDNAQPWQPLGTIKVWTDQEVASAQDMNLQTLYPAGSLVKYQGQPYVSLANVQQVRPSDPSPWGIYIDWAGTKERVGTPKYEWPAHVYAPYVDFTLNTIPDLASLALSKKITHYTMAFVVAKDANTCLPTWGTAYNINDYTQYSKIKALREAGGDIQVSIGGANNSPLAAACRNVNDLQTHYYDIVDNLNLKVLDFDIEGNWVADHESIQRRNEALKIVQERWKKEGRKVGLLFTLPILPTGLTPEGIYVLEDAKAKGVELTGINVMTMDYGNSVCQSSGKEGQNIHGKCATSAVDNLFQQVKKIWPEKSDSEVNGMLGTTPMIGYNDVQGETFYLSDAHLVMQQAQDRKIGMIGIWSMARDQPGEEGYVGPENSGLPAAKAPLYAFSDVFSPFTVTSGANTGGGGSSGGGSQPTPTPEPEPTPSNTPPVANAGVSQTVQGTQTVNLDGSGSTDADGNALTYQWTQTAGPSATLANANQARAIVTLPSASRATYTFRLTVNDGQSSAYADTSVTVLEAAQPVKPTIALAPTFQTQSGNPIVITATATDPDSTSAQLNWSWTLPSGIGQVTGQSTNTLTITGPSVTAIQSYPLTVRVTDQSGLSDTAATVLQVSPVAAPSGGDFQYVYPQNISQYKGGTRVKAKDGGIYECKPFPYSGWCKGAAWAYAPGEGLNWKDAWIKR